MSGHPMGGKKWRREQLKVDVVCRRYTGEFVQAVNESIEGKKVVDIKFTSDDGYFTALIMYEEDE